MSGSATGANGSPTDEAARRALALLTLLSDDELSRYGEIARDQANAEWSSWRIEGAILAAAIAALGASLFHWGYADLTSWFAETSGARAMLAVVLAAMIYLPYRRAKNLKLWKRHRDAVRDEQRRRLSAGATGVRIDVAR